MSRCAGQWNLPLTPSCVPLQSRRRSVRRHREPRHVLPTPNGTIVIGRLVFDAVAPRPTFSAAMTVVPEPRKGSRVRLPLDLQSRIASATSATGFTVGCISSASSRPRPSIHARIGPHVPAISAVPSLLHVVFVLSGADSKHANQFILASVKASLARICLHLDAP